MIAFQIVEPYHAPSYEIRHSVRDHLGERVREEVGNPAVGVVAGSSRIADFRGVGRQVNYVADPSGLRAHIRTNEVAAAPQYVSPYLVNPYYRSFGHDGFVYPQYGLGYNRFELGYGYNGPLFNRYGYGNALGYSGLLEIMLSTMEFLMLNKCNIFVSIVYFQKYRIYDLKACYMFLPLLSV
ncbi:hypothetical protein CEXT_487851 [Caerostris extrusa]|uniref:Uncharacterized protein n=1 Tax=Caerostris extrusa TaxID=172846 RepID=A0AAV4UIR1_CAEEX|nr:hypothetical protein CEXT_487851 [Caerostris extrusa]